MLRERVTGVMDGEITPLPSDPLLTSDGTDWSGFLLERHRVEVSREEVGWSWHDTHVGVCISGQTCIELEGEAGDGRFLVKPGDISLFPKGCDHTTIRLSGDGAEFLVVQFDGARLHRLYQEESLLVDTRLVPQAYEPDERVRALLSNMASEIEAGCPSGPLYGESLSLALATYVANRYSRKGPALSAGQCRFSPRQIRLVLDFIDTHLGKNVSLVEIARVIQLSPRHFSRMFKETFGTTLHRYLLNQRVKRAKSLLIGRRLPIIEISEILGFASQSHFTDVFRRATGISPKRYQQEH